MSTPPGEERPVADRLIAELRGLGLDVDEDGAGAEVGGNTGQPVRRLEPTAEGTPLFLCSHMDTVPPVGPIEPVVEDGVVRNAAGTILGADNKSAVVAMVEAARRVVEGKLPHAGLELLFTPKEEVGLRGAAGVRLLAASLPASGYVYDQAGPIGEVVLGAPHSMIMEVTFTGPVRARRDGAGGGPLRDRRRRARDRRHAARPASTRRPRRTSGRSRAASRGTSSPTAARSTPRRARTTRRSSPTSSRRCSTPARSRPR